MLIRLISHMKWMKQGSKYFYWATKLTLLVHIRILDSTKKFVAYNDQKKIKIDVKLIWQLYGFLNSICLQAINELMHVVIMHAPRDPKHILD